MISPRDGKFRESNGGRSSTIYKLDQISRAVNRVNAQNRRVGCVRALLDRECDRCDLWVSLGSSCYRADNLDCVGGASMVRIVTFYLQLQEIRVGSDPISLESICVERHEV